MDDLKMATTPWTGTERRGGERRMSGYEFGGTERRAGSDRRSFIDISAPADLARALSDAGTLGARDSLHPRGGTSTTPSRASPRSAAIPSIPSSCPCRSARSSSRSLPMPRMP